MAGKYALLIGNTAYSDPTLKQMTAPARDVEALARVLHDPGIGAFDAVETVLDQVRASIEERIDDFFDGRTADDLLLLYFSGHGVKDYKDNGHLYLAVANTNSQRLPSTGVAASFIDRIMRRCDARSQVLLLDCCHAAAFFRGLEFKADASAGVLEQLGRGRIVLASSDAAEYSYVQGEGALSGSGAQSLFTQALVEGLSGEADLQGDADGVTSMTELIDYIERRLASSKQRPVKSVLAAHGQIVLGRNPKPRAIALPADLLQFIDDKAPPLHKKLAVNQLAEYLSGSDPGLALAARDALRKLADDDSRMVSDAARAALAGSGAPPAKPQRIESQRETPARVTAPLRITTPLDMEFVQVPAGEFLMGSDPKRDNAAGEDEQPQHKVYLDAYQIGKYPVTHAQWAAYATAAKLDFKAPQDKLDHPVVEVSWDDAQAFCAWLSKATGQPIRLPTEAEWEKAARGVDGRIYPWGDEQPDKNRCNAENWFGGTTAAGRFSPAGDSPCGAADMAGNVWEWCEDGFDREVYASRARQVARNPLNTSGSRRVLRGGSWGRDLRYARAAYRYGVDPHNRGYGLGFRVVCAPVPRPSGL